MAKETNLSELRKEQRKASKPNIEESLDSAGGMKDGWHKLGNEYDQCAVGPEGFHIQGGNNLIAASDEGTRLSAGKSLTVKIKRITDFKLELEDGSFNLHPMGHQGASSAAFPRQTFAQSIPSDLVQIAKMARSVKKIMDLF